MNDFYEVRNSSDMMTTIHIKNIGIIEDVTMELKSGFQVLTGETGAGKSLMIGSLNILEQIRYYGCYQITKGRNTTCFN